jgi:hypothetical protein
MVADPILPDPPMPLTALQIAELADVFSVSKNQISQLTHPLDEDREVIAVKMESPRSEILALASFINRKLYNADQYDGVRESVYAFIHHDDPHVLLLTVPYYDKRVFLSRLHAIAADLPAAIALPRQEESQAVSRLQRDIAELPNEQKLAIIRENVQKIVEESQQEADAIVAAAVKDFAKEYAQIKSKRMRQAVLYDLREDAGLERYEPPPALTNKTHSRRRTTLRQAVSMVVSLFSVG